MSHRKDVIKNKIITIKSLLAFSQCSTNISQIKEKVKVKKVEKLQEERTSKGSKIRSKSVELKTYNPIPVKTEVTETRATVFKTRREKANQRKIRKSPITSWTTWFWRGRLPKEILHPVLTRVRLHKDYISILSSSDSLNGSFWVHFSTRQTCQQRPSPSSVWLSSEGQAASSTHLSLQSGSQVWKHQSHPPFHQRKRKFRGPAQPEIQIIPVLLFFCGFWRWLKE